MTEISTSSDLVGKPLLWMIISCYNEEAVLPITTPLFRKELEILVSSDIEDYAKISGRKLRSNEPENFN